MATGQFAWLAEFWQLAGVTAFGFVVLAVVSAAVGYLVASGAWRVIVARRRTKRLRRMEARLDERLGAHQG